MYPHYPNDPVSSHAPRPAPAAALLLGLLVLAAALLVALRLASAPEVVPAGADATAFSAERAWPRLERLIGDGAPHPVGTPAGAEVRRRLVSEFEAVGYEVELQNAWGCRPEYTVCADVTNVLARLPGSAGGQALVLAAHYDSHGSGPGVADDMAAVAAIVEVAGMLRAEPQLRNDVIFLITDGEEVGLTGAEAFLGHPWAADVGLVANFEARGTGGRSLLFQTSPGNAWLIERFAAAAPRPVTSSLLYDLYRLLPNDTDLSVFLEAGMAGINFAFVEGVERYHTALDDLAHLDRGSFQHHGDNALAAVRAFGDADLSSMPAGNALFLDLFPGFVLQAPEGWAVWLAAGALLLWLLIVAALIGARVLGLGGLLLALLCTLLGFAAAAGLGYLVVTVLMSLTGLAEPWYAAPLPARVAVWAAGAVGFGLFATLAARRAGFWGMAAAVWLWWTLLALAAALTLPGASVVFLVPTVIATLLYALLVLLGAGLPGRGGFTVGWGAVLLALITIGATAYLTLPLALLVEFGLGFAMSAAVAFLVALGVSALAPFLAVPVGAAPLRAGLLVLGVLVMAGAGVWATQVPAFSESAPQRLTLRYFQESLDGQPMTSNWLVDRSPVAPLPDALAAAGGFSGNRVRLAGGLGSYVGSPAPALDAPPPTVSVVGDDGATAGGAARSVTLRLASPRGGERITLLVPVSAGASRIDVAGTDVSIRLTGAGTRGYHRFDCRGVACHGFELTLHLDRSEPFELLVLDQTDGLPAGGERLLAARPATAVESYEGDVTQLLNRVMVGRAQAE